MTEDEIISGLCDQRYEEIKARVADLFESCKICCLPVNAFEIAARLGLHIAPYSVRPNWTRALSLKQKDGFSLTFKGKTYIFYNDEKSYERQNWTILHEIGHHVLGHRESSIVAEREADFFAKYALIPPPLVHKLGITKPEEIQAYFNASREAARYGMNYYQKWLRQHATTFSRTETRILRLFAAAS